MRPSISLACILKNEVKNLPRLLASVKDCFDHIHLTDTGSTDGSIELIQEYEKGENPAGTPISLWHFPWVDDFAKARNASFEPVETDYVMWLDLDDVLSSAEKFIQWRNNAMKLADFWIATYHYSFNEQGKSLCSFARERVMRNDLKFSWKYFVHEGIIPVSPVKKDINVQYSVTWSVNHLRDAEDMKADRSRNLSIFEKNSGTLDSRMRYYYGKELFENQKPLEAFSELVNAVASPDLELHDRIMALQYACLSAMHLNQFDKAVQLAHQGLQLSPQRAEFFVVIGDCYIKTNRVTESIPYYNAASKCGYFGDGKIQGAIFSHEDSYKHYPLNQIARVYANIGDIDRAEAAVGDAIKLGPNPETLGIHGEIIKIKERVGIKGAPKAKTDHIVISCHPQGFYEWDEGIYKEKGIGGSETAVVEMAYWLAEITEREVLVFNNRATAKKFGRVSYLPASELPKYFNENSPYKHIAWRHNIPLSDDPMYIWCHDLGFAGVDGVRAPNKVLALSEFHRNYLVNMFGVDKDCILVTSNGIDPDRFVGMDKQKDFGKVVWSSSPDRGLERAIKVMDIVVKDVPEATFHIYYGFDNMLKMQKHEEVTRLQKMIEERPYIKFHGNLEQRHLTKELNSACAWLYPTNFLETYCITAIEMLASKVYPIVRRWGALEDTLKSAYNRGDAALVDRDCDSDDDIAYYAVLTRSVLQLKAWEKMGDDEDHSWKKVAESWLGLLDIEVKDGRKVAGNL